jgi:uncharacterized protein
MDRSGTNPHFQRQYRYRTSFIYQGEKMKTKLYLLIPVLVLGFALSACTPSAITVQSQPIQRIISVTGSGMVTLTPDIAYIYIGVHTQDASASAAMNENNQRTQAVIDSIKASGVEDKDIQTTNFSVSPQPIYDANYNQIGTTYAVDNTVYVTVRDLTQLGNLLDSSVQAGANTINSITFDVADKTAALSQARLAAVTDARKQAEELTTAANVTLGEVQNISYYDSSPTPIYMNARADMAVSSSVPIQAGTMQVTTTVSIVYEIH